MCLCLHLPFPHFPPPQTCFTSDSLKDDYFLKKMFLKMIYRKIAAAYYRNYSQSPAAAMHEALFSALVSTAVSQEEKVPCVADGQVRTAI